jgi:ABC-2 type transport system permease protein
MLIAVGLAGVGLPVAGSIALAAAIHQPVGRLAGSVPAIRVVGGLAGVAFGWLPRWTVWAWAALILFMLFGQFGTLLHLSHWVLVVSPFSHVPSLPGVAFDADAASHLVGLSVLAVALAAVSTAGVRGRDIGASRV